MRKFELYYRLYIVIYRKNKRNLIKKDDYKESR